MHGCAPGVPYTAIGAACAEVAQRHKLTVVRDFIGHGVGTVFHAAPQILPHQNNERGTMLVRDMGLGCAVYKGAAGAAMFALGQVDYVSDMAEQL